MSSSSTVDPDVDAGRQEQSFRWLWLGPVVVIVVLGGVGLWLALGGDDEPTLSFDGTQATYNGPEVLEAGNTLFKIENDSDVVADFLWGRHGEEGITLEQTVAWAETNTDQPPWVEEALHLVKDLAPHSTGERLAWMTAGTYELIVWDVQAEKAHVAAIITVTDSE